MKKYNRAGLIGLSVTIPIFILAVMLLFVNISNEGSMGLIFHSGFNVGLFAVLSGVLLKHPAFRKEEK